MLMSPIEMPKQSIIAKILMWIVLFLCNFSVRDRERIKGDLCSFVITMHDLFIKKDGGDGSSLG